MKTTSILWIIAGSMLFMLFFMAAIDWPKNDNIYFKTAAGQKIYLETVFDGGSPRIYKLRGDGIVTGREMLEPLGIIKNKMFTSLEIVDILEKNEQFKKIELNESFYVIFFLNGEEYLCLQKEGASVRTLEKKFSSNNVYIFVK